MKIIPADNPADLLKEVDIMLACTSPYIVRLHDCYYKVSVASPNLDLACVVTLPCWFNCGRRRYSAPTKHRLHEGWWDGS